MIRATPEAPCLWVPLCLLHPLWPVFTFQIYLIKAFKFSPNLAGVKYSLRSRCGPVLVQQWAFLKAKRFELTKRKLVSWMILGSGFYFYFYIEITYFFQLLLFENVFKLFFFLNIIFIFLYGLKKIFFIPTSTIFLLCYYQEFAFPLTSPFFSVTGMCGIGHRLPLKMSERLFNFNLYLNGYVNISFFKILLKTLYVLLMSKGIFIFYSILNADMNCIKNICFALLYFYHFSLHF